MPYSGEVVDKQKQPYKEWKIFSEPSSRDDRKEVDPVCLSSEKAKEEKGPEKVPNCKTKSKYKVVCILSLCKELLKGK